MEFGQTKRTLDRCRLLAERDRLPFEPMVISLRGSAAERLRNPNQSRTASMVCRWGIGCFAPSWVRSLGTSIEQESAPAADQLPRLALHRSR
jgi:hypothetical protein